jgi:hypothetical protein
MIIHEGSLGHDSKQETVTDACRFEKTWTGRGQLWGSTSVSSLREWYQAPTRARLRFFFKELHMLGVN